MEATRSRLLHLSIGPETIFLEGKRILRSVRPEKGSPRRSGLEGMRSVKCKKPIDQLLYGGGNHKKSANYDTERDRRVYIDSKSREGAPGEGGKCQYVGDWSSRGHR